VFEREPHLGTWFHSAPYGIYKLACGQHVALSMNDPAKLAKALGSDKVAALVGVNTYDDRDRFAATMAEVLATKTFQEIEGPFDAEAIWYARVNDYESLRRNPQVIHAELLREIPAGSGKAVVVGHPLRYDGKAPASAEFASMPGQHTKEVLAEIGLSAPEVDELLGRGAAHAPA
jgi:crotonobetainyl-CoA:carnitine CoA-transferase CaiB-like acyl-CoA transferase